MIKNEKIIAAFDEDVRFAYVRLLRDYTSIGRNAYNDEILPDVEITAALIKQVVGRLGARVGAAVKVAKRTLVVDALEKEKQAGFDITPTHANNITCRLLGRKFDTRALKVFVTPGRTAASKSCISEEDTEALEKELSQDMSELLKTIEAVKEKARDRWSKSHELLEIREDWAQQRKSHH